MAKDIKKTLGRVATIVACVAILLTALYIMLNGLGLVDSLDFGAGAYYYADIPEFDRYVNDDAYATKLPLWAAIVLFLAWGWLMYRLWCWIDKRK